MATADLARKFSRFVIHQRSLHQEICSSSLFFPRNAFLRKRHFTTNDTFQLLPNQGNPVKAAAELDLDSLSSDRSFGARIDIKRLRVVPASPSYFSGRPQFTDDYLMLTALLARWQRLPTCRPGEAPRALWKDADSYIATTGEPVKPTRYARLVGILRRLNMILPLVMPEEVKSILKKFERSIDPALNQPRPILIDEHGRARAIGRRKESSAIVWLVEGNGEILVNGKTLDLAFRRQHDRESAIWPLTVTGRLERYNVFGIVRGGGTTGQAEAMTLGLARALIAHEPGIKAHLRKAGVVERDPRMVERKKPGKRKARKMPAWVKR